MKLHALLSGVPHKGPALDPEITAVVYDSRKAGPGALFVCLPGEQADGHDYATAAYQAGCRAFLAQRALNLPADAAQVLVPDSRSALALVGAAFYGHPADETLRRLSEHGAAVFRTDKQGTIHLTVN